MRAGPLLDDLELARVRAAEIAEARKLASLDARLPLGGIADIAGSIARVRKAAALEAPELVAVATTGPRARQAAPARARRTPSRRRGSRARRRADGGPRPRLSPDPRGVRRRWPPRRSRERRARSAAPRARVDQGSAREAHGRRAHRRALRAVPAGRVLHAARGSLRPAGAHRRQGLRARHRARHVAERPDAVHRARGHRRSQQPDEARGGRDPGRGAPHPREVLRVGRRGGRRVRGLGRRRRAPRRDRRRGDHGGRHGGVRAADRPGRARRPVARAPPADAARRTALRRQRRHARGRRDAAYLRSERGRQDGRAQDHRPRRADDARGPAPDGRERQRDGLVHRRRHRHRRRTVARQGPVDVLGPHGEPARAARDRGARHARADRRDRGRHRPGAGRGARPGGARGAERPRRDVRRDDALRPAQGARRIGRALRERVGRLRSRQARADVQAASRHARQLGRARGREAHGHRR